MATARRNAGRQERISGRRAGDGARPRGWLRHGQIICGAAAILLLIGCSGAPRVELPLPESGEFLTLAEQRALSGAQLEKYCGMLGSYLDGLRADVALARSLQDSLSTVLDSLTVETGRLNRNARELERELRETKLRRDTTSTYVTKEGDTLTSLGTLFYGSTSNWRKIYNANRDQIEDPQVPLKPGLRLTIPR
ncbi:MAG: LysM peptidoglycan-binding domain-containing protein [Candidatus Eisenbacteria sp.]|nr:LysM peptidoglycan-binding domain-containing protein [Candidatus Eisenbacteria bacterium]